MKRSTLNFVIDAAALAAFVFLTATGVLARYVLPPGSGRFTTLWGLDRHGWGDVHFWVAAALLAVMAVHLLLHWKWILGMIRGKKTLASGIRAGLGAVGLVGLLALAAAPFFAPVERAAEPQQQSRAPEDGELHSGELIRGSTTLAEAAASAGMPLHDLLKALGLPETIDPQEQIGRLRKAHGIAPDDVRRAIREYESE